LQGDKLLSFSVALHVDEASCSFLMSLFQALAAFLLVLFTIIAFLPFNPNARPGEKHKRFSISSAKHAPIQNYKCHFSTSIKKQKSSSTKYSNG
jgi:hypothetical protein